MGVCPQKSFQRYSRFRSFMSRVLEDVDLALMQYGSDAQRIIDLGMERGKVEITSNLKFDQAQTVLIAR